MTETEKQQIISLVLQALKTNSLTIEQLTDTTELSKDMYVEVSGGRKISIDLLSSTIAKMVNGDFDALVENVNKIAKDLSDGDAELLKRITGVSDKSNPLTDPFKSIGSFTTIGSFKDKLKTMYSGDSSIGNYRCILSVDSSKIPVNIQIERLELNKVCQSFTSCIQLATMSDNAEGVYLGTVCTNSRIGIVSNESVTWGKWTSVINDFEERIGKANGIAPLNEESKVPSECLPEPLSLGEGEEEAFPGNRGKSLEDTMKNIPSDIIKPGSFSVLSDASYLNVYFKKVSKTTGKETDDSFRLPSATLEQAGLLSAEDKQALEDMKSGTPADDVTHPIVIVDEIRPLKDGYYTLETAIAAVVSSQQETGINSERTGLIITYKTGEYEMETRQFQGAVSDFNEVHFGRTLAVKVRKWNLVMLPKRGAIKPSQPVVRMIASLWTFLLTPRLKALSKFKWSTPKAKVSAKRNSFLSVPAVVEEVVVLLWPLLLNPLPFTGHTVHLSRDVRLSVP